MRERERERERSDSDLSGMAKKGGIMNKWEAVGADRE